MKKRLISLLFVLVLCLCMALSALAADGGFVFDLDGVVRETDALNSEAREIYDETGVALYFIYTEDLNGLESADFVQQFAQAHGFYENRVILMEGPTSYYICAEGAVKDRLTRDDIAAMQDVYANEKTYEGGIRAYYSAALDALGDAETSAHSDRLIDGGALLTDAQETAIAARLDEISEKHDLDLVIVTETTLNGRDKVGFADDFYDYGGYREDGILLLYCPSEGTRHFSTTGEAKTIFDDDALDKLVDTIVPYFDRGDVNGACLAFADTCDEIVTDARSFHFPWGLLIFGLLIGAGLSFLIPMSVMKSKLKSVRFKAAASDYVRPGSMILTQNRDVFLFANVTKTPIPRDTSSRSGGGGGGFHVGSSGTSHGGRSF